MFSPRMANWLTIFQSLLNMESRYSVLGALKFSYSCFRSVFCVFLVASLAPNINFMASNNVFSSVVTGPGVVEVEVPYAFSVVLGMLRFGNIRHTHMFARSPRNNYVTKLELKPVMLEARDSMQQMENMISDGITLHGYYSNQQNVQPVMLEARDSMQQMLQLNLMEPPHDGYYVNQESMQGLEQRRYRRKVKNVCWDSIYSSLLRSVYSVGCGLGWKIGHGTKNDEKQPRLIEQFQTLNLQPMVVGRDGRVRTWGWGRYGCFGHGNEDCDSVPKVFESLSNVKVVHVATGDYTIFVISNGGDVYTFGCGESSSLGHNTAEVDAQILCLNGFTVVFLNGFAISFALENIGGHGAAIEENRSTNSEVKFYMFKI
ncbi:ultraviolet-B receptor UVR8 [Tanacetum coccineum]